MMHPLTGSPLQRNLVDNGGWLDEVLWVANTDDKGDLGYLDEIIAKHPTRYKKMVPSEKLWVYTYKEAWQNIERGKYYVKIDDDIVRVPVSVVDVPLSEKICYVRTARG